MSHGQAVARNAAWLLAATTAQKAISFLTFMAVARIVGVRVTGEYAFAISVTSIFVILTDLGLTPVVIREMAADRASGEAALGRALRLKAWLIPLGIAASLGFIFLLITLTRVRLSMEPHLIWRPMTPDEWRTLTAVAIACFVMSSDALSLLWYGAMRGLRQLRYEAFGMLIAQILTAAVSIMAALVSGDPRGLIVGLLVGSAWNVAWSSSRARKLRIIAPATSAWSARRLFRQAVPFALAGAFVKIYSYVDALFLQHFHSAIGVGFYSAAYKVTYAFQFLPLAFTAALYPGMSSAFASKDEKALRSLLAGSLRLMLVVSVPLSAILSGFASEIIHLAAGAKFAGAVEPLRILSWVLIPIFLDFPIGSLLNATRRAGLKTAAMGVTMAVNVIANALLVPSLGPVGAAMAGVLSFWILFFLGVWFARHDLPGFSASASLFGRGFLVAGLLWFFIREVSKVVPLSISVVLTALAALFMLWASRLLLVDDLRLLIRWFRRAPAPPDAIDEKLHSRK